MSADDCSHEVREAHNRLDDHEEVLDYHDRRITQNENWRLQAQGALKVITFILGLGGLAAILDWLTAII